MVEVKQIQVPIFDQEGSVIGTEKIIVKWLCPTCGEKMGAPSNFNLVKQETVYAVDLWANPCGHIPKVGELLRFQKKFAVRSNSKVREYT